MPNCFSLTRKSNPEAGPVPLTTVDEELCKFLGMPVDPKRYCGEWYSHIGFALACGKSFAQIREDMAKIEDEYTELYIKMVDWFSEHFISDCWAEVGR